MDQGKVGGERLSGVVDKPLKLQQNYQTEKGKTISSTYI